MLLFLLNVRIKGNYAVATKGRRSDLDFGSVHACYNYQCLWILDQDCDHDCKLKHYVVFLNIYLKLQKTIFSVTSSSFKLI